VTPDETPTYEPPVDGLAAAVEAATGMAAQLGDRHGELDLYLGRHRQLGYLTTFSVCRWSRLP
jgi:hypothetical protein